MQDNSNSILCITQKADVVYVKGSMTFSSVDFFQYKLNFLSDLLEINLSELSHIDSAGLALLIYWINLARSQQKQIKFVKMPSNVMSAIKIRGLKEVFNDTESSQTIN